MQYIAIFCVFVLIEIAFTFLMALMSKSYVSIFNVPAIAVAIATTFLLHYYQYI